MQRLFGTSKPAVPKATLTDVIATTDSRADSMSVKIRRLDVELAQLKVFSNSLYNP
jgi:charged multivesicular body protein 5